MTEVRKSLLSIQGVTELKPHDYDIVSWNEFRVDESDIDIVKTIVSMYFNHLLEKHQNSYILLGNSHEHLYGKKVIFTCSYVFINKELSTGNIREAILTDKKNRHIKDLKQCGGAVNITWDEFQMRTKTRYIKDNVLSFFNNMSKYIDRDSTIILGHSEENVSGCYTDFKCWYAVTPTRN